MPEERSRDAPGGTIRTDSTRERSALLVGGAHEYVAHAGKWVDRTLFRV
jgi:hypothetical protein